VLEEPLELVLVLLSVLELALVVVLALVLVRVHLGWLVLMRFIDWSGPRTADCQRVLASCAWRASSCSRRSRAAVHFANQRGSFSNALTRDAASPLVLHGRRVGRAACSAVVSSLEVVAEAALEVGGAVVEAVGPVRMSVVALGIDGRLRELVHAKGDKAETRGSHRV
jgi:hypothetical protein